MYYRGNLSVLADFLKGEPTTICAEGGGYRSVTIVGMLEAIAKTRLKAKAYAGVSGSAWAIAAHLCGEDGSTFETFARLAQDNCILVKWGFSPFGPRMFFNRDQLVRESLRDLNVQAVERVKEKFGVAVLEHATGKGHVLDGRVNVIDKLSATSSIPGACNPYPINGVNMVDGIGVRIDRGYWTRNVIVLRARRYWWWEEWAFPYLTHINLALEPWPLRCAIADMDRVFDRGLNRLRECTQIQHIEIGPDDDDPFIWPFTTDVGLLWKMRRNAREYMLRLFDVASLMRI